MLRIQYVTTRVVAWSVWLWSTLHLLYSKHLFRFLSTGHADFSAYILFAYLILSSIVLTYQMMLNQRLIQDVTSSIQSFVCDILTISILTSFTSVHQGWKQQQQTSNWYNSFVIAVAILLGYKWKGRFMEIRADRTISRFIKSFSVHISDKSIKVGALLLIIFVIKECILFTLVTLVSRRPLVWNLPFGPAVKVLMNGLWYNFLLDYSMVTLEYFLFHPINFTLSPWVQIIPKMGVRSIKGQDMTNPNNRNQTVVGEHFLMDYLHGLSQEKVTNIPRRITSTGKTLLRTVHETYALTLRQLLHQRSSASNQEEAVPSHAQAYSKAIFPINGAPSLEFINSTPTSKILGIQQFVFTSHLSAIFSSQSQNSNSSWTHAILAPIYGYLECQAFFDLHRITRSSKLRREPLFRVHFEEWLSGALSFFLVVTLQMKEVLYFVKEPYETEDFLRDMASMTSSTTSEGDNTGRVALAANGLRTSIGVETMVKTQGQGMLALNEPFTFPRSPVQRQHRISLFDSPVHSPFSKDLKHAPIKNAKDSPFSPASVYQSYAVNYLMNQFFKSAIGRSISWLQVIDTWCYRVEVFGQVSCFLLLGSLYQSIGFLWQLPLRGEVSDRKRGGTGSEITSSLRRYFARWFSPLFAQELVNALDSTSTLLLLALREDHTASGMKSTGALLAVVYVLLLFEETIEEIIDLLHQTHTTKVSMAKAMMSTSVGGASGMDISTVAVPAAHASDVTHLPSTSGAVSYRRFKLKSLQSLPREIIALRRGVKEALAKIWGAYVDILIVQELPVEVQARASEYRHAAMVGQGR